MEFISALSKEKTTRAALDEVLEMTQRVDDADVVFVFFTSHHCEFAGDIVSALQAEFSPQHLAGCSCEGVIGMDQEVEGTPGLSLLVAKTPGVNISPVYVDWNDWQDILDDPDEINRRFGSGADLRARILLGDPFSTPVIEMLEALDSYSPGVPNLGGMASGSNVAGGNILINGDEIVTNGVVGAAFSGPIIVDTLVSQGCKPVGETMLVTRADEGVIMEIGHRPALQALEEMVQKLPPKDQSLLQSGVYVGVVINEYKSNFSPEDFLVRNLLGADASSGAVVLTDVVRPGQTIQLHLRDADSAHEELNTLLKQHAELVNAPHGALLFSCNGRGKRMFDTPDHDVQAVLKAIPNTPIAGFFAQGELGPVGGRSFIHGHTASFAFFRPDIQNDM